jgi:5-methylcytosine-specific restriction endonuclease McrA
MKLSKDPMRQLLSRERREIRVWLLEKYGPYCQLCLQKGLSKAEAEIDLDTYTGSGRGPLKWSVDHIIPFSKGGLNVKENMQPAHQSCNRDKGAKMPGVDNKPSIRYSSVSNNY